MGQNPQENGEISEIIASRNPMRILENTAAYSTKFRAYNFFAGLI